MNAADIASSAKLRVDAELNGFEPRIGMILGTGHSAIASKVDAIAEFDYADLPGFPPMKVAGHPGELIIGTLWGQKVACLCGRSHLYEGVSVQSLARPVRLLKDLGCEMLVVTNAAGAMEPEMTPGSLMSISDHINLTGFNPLIGENEAGYGPRFVDMTEAYDWRLRKKLRRAAEALDLHLFEGVFVGVSGPSFETPAEIHAFNILGGRVVGMSTVHEVITARHCGLRVIGISCITNLAAGLGTGLLSREKTQAGKAQAVEHLSPLLQRFFEDLGDV